jgi:transposase
MCDVKNNASVHHSGLVEQICSAAGIKLFYLPTYVPDLNLIENLFAKPKAFSYWKKYDKTNAISIFPREAFQRNASRLHLFHSL